MAFTTPEHAGLQTPPATGAWPALRYRDWADTCATLHRYSQVVGKVRVALTPWVNHSWHSALYVTSRGLTTSPIPYNARRFEIDFDFIEHQLIVRSDDGQVRRLPLRAEPVADFYARVMQALDELNLGVRITTLPNEIPDAIPLDEDREHRSYDPDAVQRFWRALSQVDRVLKLFRTGFIGKVSPVHFFWGSFDMAVTRFSGRRAPLHPGGIPNLPDAVTREAYSHEVSSAGFWPGGPQADAAFYSYAYPEPEGFRSMPVEPAAAKYHPGLGEFVLPYAAVQQARDPDAALLSFLQTTYEAAADCANWAREELECEFGKPRVPRRIDGVSPQGSTMTRR